MYGLPKKAAKPAEPVNDQDERRIWETPDNKTGGVRGGISQGKERPVNPGHTCGNRHFRRRGYDGDPAGGKEKAASGYAKGRRQEAMAEDPISVEEDTHPFTGGPENRGK